MFKIALICATVLTLSACSKGISVGTDSTTGSDDSRKLDLGFSKSLTAGTSANISATMPATQAISEGMRAVVDVADINIAWHVQNIKFNGHQLDMVPYALDYLGYGEEGTPAVIVERANTIRNTLFKFKDSDPVRIFVAEKLLECTDLALEVKPEAKNCYSDFYLRTSAAAAILAASWPQKTPGLGPEVVDSTGSNNTRYFQDDYLYPWLYGSLRVVTLASQVQYAIAQKLEGPVMKNPESANQAVVELLFNLPADTIMPLVAGEYVNSFQTLQAAVSNGVLHAPVEVAVAEFGGVLSQNEKGLLLSKNGSPWFGDGHIQGFKTDIALARTTGTSMDRKQSMALDKAEKATQSNKAGVSLQ